MLHGPAQAEEVLELSGSLSVEGKLGEFAQRCRIDQIEPPFSTGRLLSEAQKKALEAEALRANNRYVLGFLEEHNLYPYARAGRERGLTERVVHFAEPKPRPVEPAAAAEEAPATGALPMRGLRTGRVA